MMKTPPLDASVREERGRASPSEWAGDVTDDYGMACARCNRI